MLNALFFYGDASFDPGNTIQGQMIRYLNIVIIIRMIQYEKHIQIIKNVPIHDHLLKQFTRLYEN